MPSECTTTVAGRLGETIAAAYLELQGYTVRARNVRRGRREIDLVATRGDLTCFVEVRLRRRNRFGTAIETIDYRKRRRVWSAATEIGAVRGGASRFDVIAIDWRPDGGLVLAHVVDAIRAGEG
jgi:putative endonuclease